jgi:hypothetical protein
MKRFALATAMVTAATVAAFVGSATADAAGRWRLDFTAGEFSYVVAGKGRSSRVQYILPYTVTNGSEGTRAPRLRIEVRTDTDKTFGDHFDGRAFQAAKKKLGKKAISSTAQLRSQELDTGATAEGLAHFGRMDDHADGLEVRVYGLWDPVVRDRTGKLWDETRVLVIKYRRYGDEYRRYEDKIYLESSTPIVEGEPGEIERTAKPTR